MDNFLLLKYHYLHNKILLNIILYLVKNITQSTHKEQTSTLRKVT